VALIKCDENLPDAAAEILRAAGHDVALARDEGLMGAEDDVLLARASAERRTVVTMDIGFGDIRRHTPTGTAGIVVLRVKDHSLGTTQVAISRLATFLTLETPDSRLRVLTETKPRIWPAGSEE